MTYELVVQVIMNAVGIFCNLNVVSYKIIVYKIQDTVIRIGLAPFHSLFALSVSKPGPLECPSGAGVLHTSF